MVVIFLPVASETGVLHERTGRPARRAGAVAEARAGSAARERGRGGGPGLIGRGAAGAALRGSSACPDGVEGGADPVRESAAGIGGNRGADCSATRGRTSGK